MKDRFAVIADRVAGYSFALDDFAIEVEGWQPVNVDVLREISRTYFDFLDDEGRKRDDGIFQVTGTKRLTPPMTYYQEQEMKRQHKTPVTMIRGSIPADSQAWAHEALRLMFRRKFGLEMRQIA